MRQDFIIIYVISRKLAPHLIPHILPGTVPDNGTYTAVRNVTWDFPMAMPRSPFPFPEANDEYVYLISGLPHNFRGVITIPLGAAASPPLLLLVPPVLL